MSTEFSVTGTATGKVTIGSLGLGPAAFQRDDGTRWAVIQSGQGGYFCYDTRNTDTLSPNEIVTPASNVAVTFS